VSQIHIDIDSSSLEEELLKLLNSEFPVFMLQLPPVFALIAPATQKGVNALNNSKSRIPGKYYGSAIGELSKFMSIARKEFLPDIFQGSHHRLDFLESSFIRLRVTDENVESPVIKNGTHQGLLLEDSKERSIFRFIENSSNQFFSNPLYHGLHYHAPICTSANESGDPNGAITDYDEAMHFAKDKNIPLIITNKKLIKGSRSGSYPIFSFYKNTYSIQRHGHTEEAIIEKIPKSIIESKEE
jgi:hypothetical protein